MSAASPLEEVLTAEPSLAMGLDPTAVLVRTLTLPTASPRQARQAVRLQLDRLSPAPESEILYELVRLSEPSGAGAILWAVGFVRRAEVIRACEVLSRPSVGVEKTAAGRAVTFRFRDPARPYGFQPSWAPWIMPAAVVAFAVATLMGAIDLRVHQDLAAREARMGSADEVAERLWRDASDRDVAIRSWMAADSGKAASVVLCATRAIAGSDAERHVLVSLDGGPGQATVTVAGALSPALARQPGVAVAADAADVRRQTARFTAATCVAPAP